MEDNIYYERCMDFLARMIEKYGGEIDLPGASAGPQSVPATEAEGLPSQPTYTPPPVHCRIPTVNELVIILKDGGRCYRPPLVSMELFKSLPCVV